MKRDEGQLARDILPLLHEAAKHQSSAWQTSDRIAQLLAQPEDQLEAQDAISELIAEVANEGQTPEEVRAALTLDRAIELVREITTTDNSTEDEQHWIRCLECGFTKDDVEIIAMVAGLSGAVCCELKLEQNLSDNACPE